MVNENAALERAYAHCEQLARDHYENFPVASRLLPRSMRPHIAAIYGIEEFETANGASELWASDVNGHGPTFEAGPPRRLAALPPHIVSLEATPDRTARAGNEYAHVRSFPLGRFPSGNAPFAWCRRGDERERPEGTAPRGLPRRGA